MLYKSDPEIIEKALTRCITISVDTDNLDPVAHNYSMNTAFIG